MPMRPPSSDRTSASTRNWARMSRPRAPIALRMPISRVRSRTETSMMFMIPMPPTMSEIEAMPAEQQRQRAADRGRGSSSWVWSKTLKSSSSVGGEVVAVAQERGDLGAWRRSSGPPSATLTPIVRTLSPPTKYFCTVPIGTMTWSSGSWKPVPPLGWRMPMTRNGRPPIEISVPRSLGAEPEVVGGRRAEDGDAQVVVDADVGQERALPDLVGADRRVVRRGADDRRRRVLVAGGDESGWSRPPGATPAIAASSAIASASSSVRVVDAAAAAGRADRQQVRAEALEPVRDARGRALADADQGDDRRDADDHAEHRQGRPEPARAQPREREAEQLERCSCRRRRPSRMWTWRSAAAATSASWVMSTIVRPAAWSSWSSAMTSAPAWLSRLPVGSSARISAGSVTSARAMATRCCWPPDSSVGSWSRRSPRPEPLERGRRPRARVRSRADALVQQRRRDVVERGRPRQQVVRLEDEADRPAADARQAVVVEVRDRRPGEHGSRPASAGRGSRGCSSSCSCRSRTARRWRRTRPAGPRG